MSSQTVLSQKKRRGPAPTGKGQLIGVRLQPGDLAALDNFVASLDVQQTRPQAIRAILADWLAGHGHLGRHAHPGCANGDPQAR